MAHGGGLDSKQLGLHKSSPHCSRCRTCCPPGNRTSRRTQAPGMIGCDWSWWWVMRWWRTREQVLTSSASLHTWVSASNTLPSEQPNLFGSCKGQHHCHIQCTSYIPCPLESQVREFWINSYLVVIAGEVVLTVSGMSINGVSLQKVLGSNGVPASGAGEAVHFQKLLGVVAHSR